MSFVLRFASAWVSGTYLGVPLPARHGMRTESCSTASTPLSLRLAAAFFLLHPLKKNVGRDAQPAPTRERLFCTRLHGEACTCVHCEAGTHMWALNDAPITNRQAVNLLSEWKKRHWLHSDRWLPLRQAPYFGVRPLTGSERRPHLLVPAKLLSQDPPRAVPFSHLDASLQSTIVRRHPPAFSLRGFPMLVEASRDQAHTFVWRQASASEFLDGCLFPRHGDATRNHLLADPQLVAHEGDRQWPSSAVPILNVQETTNPFAIDASLEHVDMISRAPLATCYSSGLTTVAAQFGYASLMWLDSDQLTSQKLRLTADAADTAAHAVPVTETPALYHVSQLSVPEQAKWLQRIPRFVLLHSLTTPFVLFRGCWTTWRRFGLTTPPSLDHVYRANPSLPQGSSQPLLWVCPWHSTSLDQADQLTDGFTGSPLHLQRNYSASFFNACQLTKE